MKSFLLTATLQFPRIALGLSEKARLLFLPSASVVILRAASQQDLFSVLWILVFAFATMNILGMAARRLDPETVRRRMNLGELGAIMIVVVAVTLLGWEMANVFHIFPLKIHLESH